MLSKAITVGVVQRRGAYADAQVGARRVVGAVARAAVAGGVGFGQIRVDVAFDQIELAGVVVPAVVDGARRAPAIADDLDVVLGAGDAVVAHRRKEHAVGESRRGGVAVAVGGELDVLAAAHHHAGAGGAVARGLEVRRAAVDHALAGHTRGAQRAVVTALNEVVDGEGDQVAGLRHVRADAPHPVGGRQRVRAVADPVDDAAGEIGDAIIGQVLVDVLVALDSLLVIGEVVVAIQVDVDGVVHARGLLVHHQHGRTLIEQGFQGGVGMRAEMVDAALAGGLELVGVACRHRAADGREGCAERAIRVRRQVAARTPGAGVGIIRRQSKDAHAALDVVLPRK